jgi:F-type H+-transporting ATPase subunit b
MIPGDLSLLAQALVASEGAKQPSIIYFDWTLLYEAGLFIALMIFLSKVLYKPILEVFEAREKAHLEPDRLAKDLTSQAANMDASYQKIRSEALTDGNRIRNELLKDAGERQRAHLAEAKKKADGIIEENRRQLAESQLRLREELPGRADALASLLADRLLGRQ